MKCHHIDCTTAFVEDKRLHVDGKPLPFPHGMLLIQPDKTLDKIFMLLGDNFAKECLPPIMLELDEMRASSISIVSHDQQTIELVWEEVKGRYFPYIIAINDKNIFYQSVVGDLSAIKIEECPCVPDSYRTTIAAILTTSMIDPYLGYCGVDKRSALLKMHEGARDAILKQPCMIFFSEEKPVGFLSWKQDLTWKEPTVSNQENCWAGNHEKCWTKRAACWHLS